MSKIEKKICLFCNKKFVAKGKNHRFCSRRCSKSMWRKNNPEKVKKYLKKSNEKWRRKTPMRIREINRNFVKKHVENRNKLIRKLGGKCSRCGYNEFISSLVLHHKTKNRDEKWKRHYYYDLNKVKIEELAVFCFNCHDALHKGKWGLNGSRNS